MEDSKDEIWGSVRMEIDEVLNAKVEDVNVMDLDI